MLCEDCGKCRGIEINNDNTYTVTCSENGEFKIHKDHVDAFRCTDKTDKIMPELRDNVLIILKCGREITVYDETVTSIEDMSFDCEWAKFGNIKVRTDEIACFGYIGG